MKHLLLLTALLLLTPKPAKADPVTMLICFGIVDWVVVNYAFGKINEKEEEKAE